MTVNELMTKRVASCSTNTSLAVPAKLMWDTDCGAIPVVDEDGIVKGMITDRDICMACFTRDSAPSAIPVRDAMSRTLYACSPESTIADGEKIMRDNKVRRIPVVDRKGKLAGVLSLADIARAVERGRSKSGKDLEPEGVLQVLEAICQPRPPNQSRRVSAP